MGVKSLSKGKKSNAATNQNNCSYIPPAQATSSSQAENNRGDDTRPPNPPSLPVFPGSTEVDWMSSQLGLLSRGHFRMLHDIIAPVGRQLTPVSVVSFLMFLVIIFPIIQSFTNSQLYTHYSVII